MFRLGQIDVGSRGVWTQRLEANGNDLDTLGMQFCAKSLPPGQVIGAASIGRPRYEHYLLATQRAEIEFRAVEIGENQFWRLGGGQHSPAQTRWSESREIWRVTDDRHSKFARYCSDVDASSLRPHVQGHAHVTATRTFRPNRPSRTAFKLLCRHVRC